MDNNFNNEPDYNQQYPEPKVDLNKPDSNNQDLNNQSNTQSTYPNAPTGSNYTSDYNQNYNQNYNNMNYNNNYNSLDMLQAPTNGMAIASLILGICSVVSFCCIYLSFILAALGIVFGILSKGKYKKFSGLAIAGIIISIFGGVLTVGITIFSIALSSSTFWEGFWDGYNSI